MSKPRKNRAKFVSTEILTEEKFKYWFNLQYKQLKGDLLDFKRVFNSIHQFVLRKTLEVNWGLVASELGVWVIEAAIEGLAANFATSTLIGVPLNVATILAHGIVIKQGISIYQRLKRTDGTTNPIFTRTEDQ